MMDLTMEQRWLEFRNIVMEGAPKAEMDAARVAWLAGVAALIQTMVCRGKDGATPEELTELLNQEYGNATEELCAICRNGLCEH